MAFKARVGLEAIRGVKTVNEIGQDHGVHPVQVGQWMKEILDQAGTLFEKKRGPKKEDGAGEPDRLYGEIRRLKMDPEGCPARRRQAQGTLCLNGKPLNGREQ